MGPKVILYVCFFLPCLLTAQSDPTPAGGTLCSQIPDALTDSYYESWDIPMLAAEKMISWPEVEIPEAVKEPIRNAFAAMFWSAATVPEADSIINKYCIHHSPSITQGCYVYPDTSYAWVKGWMMTDTLTTHPLLDSIINRYDLKVNYYAFTEPNYGYIRTSRIQNFYPIMDTLNSTEGVLDILESGYIGEGSEIIVSGSSLLFIARWGDCPSGCLGERIYGFDILDSCNVAFAGANTTRPFAPGHPQIFNCNVITSHQEMSPEQLSFSIFPNPAIESITIRTTEYTPKRHFSIVDIAGRCHVQDILPASGTIDIGSLAPGCYIIHLEMQLDGSEVAGVAKFIKT